MPTQPFDEQPQWKFPWWILSIVGMLIALAAARMSQQAALRSMQAGQQYQQQHPIKYR